MEDSQTTQLLGTSPSSKIPTFWQTSTVLMKFSLPLIIIGFAQYLLYFLNAYIVSFRQNANMLASMGIGDSLYQIIAEGLGYGFSLAFYIQFVPLVAQKEYSQGCKLFYRRIVAAFFASLPVVALFFFSYRIFIFAGVLPELAEGAYQFLISLIPATYLVFVSYTFLNFLSAYDHQNIYVWIGIVTGIIELGLVYYVVVTLQEDLYWIGILLGLYFAFRIIVSIIYCKYTLTKEFPGAWVSPSCDMFKGMGAEILHGWANGFVSLPITMLIETNIVISGGLTDVEAAVQSLIFRFYAPVVYILDDLSYAVVSKVLFYKGEGNRKLVNLYLGNGLKLMILASSCLGGLWYLTGEVLLGQVMPKGDEYKEPMRLSLRYVGLATFLNALVMHYAKLLRSHDKALLCVVALLLGSFLVHIPLGYWLCFNQHLRLEGVWIAFMAALLFDSVIMACFASRIDHSKMLNHKSEQKQVNLEPVDSKKVTMDEK